LWIATEFQRRPLVAGAYFPTRAEKPEGEDIACAVWLGIRSTLGTAKVPLEAWLRSPIRDEVPMYLLYGEENVRDAQYARYLCDQVLGADRRKLTGKRGLADTSKSGAELLDQDTLGTADLIGRYADKVLEERGLNVWTKANVETSSFPFVPLERFLR
jgi:hypothetical protein